MTPKQQRFVDEYLIDLNATQAAIRAGYSKKTAQEQSSRLLSNVMVMEAIAKEQRARAERTKIDSDWVLTRLAAESKADLADLYENDALKPIAEWPLIWRQGLVSGLDVNEEFKDGKKIGQVVKVKLSDRIKRIELIGRHIDVQAFIDRKEVTGKGGEPIKVEVEEMTNKERARQILAALRAVAETDE